MSSSTDPPPSGLSERTIQVLGYFNLLATITNQWVQVEGLREETKRRKQELRRDKVKIEAQLKAFEQLLAAQVDIEKVRAEALIAAFKAIGASGDKETILKLLDAAKEVLARPIALPILFDDGRA